MSDQDKDMQMMILEIKMATDRVYSKLEQLSSSVGRLENSLSSIDKKVEDLEKKVIILDQAIPDDLYKDMTLLKNSQETQAKIMWIMAGGLLTTLIKVFFDLIVK
jgi:hypothetical protein